MLDEDPGIQMYSHLPGTPVDDVPVGAPRGGRLRGHRQRAVGARVAGRGDRAMNAPDNPEVLFRTEEGLGLWEHRGKVAAVGIGHSPTARRWDGSPENSVGGLSLTPLRRAIEDAGVDPADIDGLVMDPVTTTGAWWPAGREVPRDVVQAFNPTDDPLDGIAQLSADWSPRQHAGADRHRLKMYGSGCMARALCIAAQAIGDGLAHTVSCSGLAQFRGPLLPGRLELGAALPGRNALHSLWGAPVCYGTALQFAEYCRKYGKTHDMMAPFIENSRRNGLMFPEGYWAQHRPEETRPRTTSTPGGSRNRRTCSTTTCRS